MGRSRVVIYREALMTLRGLQTAAEAGGSTRRAETLAQIARNYEAKIAEVEGSSEAEVPLSDERIAAELAAFLDVLDEER